MDTSPFDALVTQRNVLAVVLWMIGTLVSFSATAVGVRALSKTLAVSEILALRNAAGIAILLALAVPQPHLRANLWPRRLPLHLVRNVVHFAATYAWALGITLLPLATVFALEFTLPIWVALLAVTFLRERLTSGRIASIVLGFIGVNVVLRPGIESLQWGAFVVLGAALGFAITTIATKKLTMTETTFSILLMMNLIQLPLNLAGSAWAFWTRLDDSHVVPLIGVCVGGLSSHWCLTNAYRHGDAVMVVPLDFLRLPLIAFVGWQLYNEALDPFVFIGSAIIIAGILWNLRAEARRG
ncbi:MAG TPA: DMT family transporter [Beijerinckiaceae bacterium]